MTFTALVRITPDILAGATATRTRSLPWVLDANDDFVVASQAALAASEVPIGVLARRLHKAGVPAKRMTEVIWNTGDVYLPGGQLLAMDFASQSRHTAYGCLGVAKDKEDDGIVVAANIANNEAIVEAMVSPWRTHEFMMETDPVAIGMKRLAAVMYAGERIGDRRGPVNSTSIVILRRGQPPLIATATGARPIADLFARPLDRYDLLSEVRAWRDALPPPVPAPIDVAEMLLDAGDPRGFPEAEEILEQLSRDPDEDIRGAALVNLVRLATLQGRAVRARELTQRVEEQAPFWKAFLDEWNDYSKFENPNAVRRARNNPFSFGSARDDVPLDPTLFPNAPSLKALRTSAATFRAIDHCRKHYENAQSQDRSSSEDVAVLGAIRQVQSHALSELDGMVAPLVASLEGRQEFARQSPRAGFKEFVLGATLNGCRALTEFASQAECSRGALL